MAFSPGNPNAIFSAQYMTQPMRARTYAKQALSARMGVTSIVINGVDVVDVMLEHTQHLRDMVEVLQEQVRTMSSYQMRPLLVPDGRKYRNDI